MARDLGGAHDGGSLGAAIDRGAPGDRRREGDADPPGEGDRRSGARGDDHPRERRDVHRDRRELARRRRKEEPATGGARVPIKRLRTIVKDARPWHRPVDVERPRTRGDCVDGPRPCPWYGCKFHLGLDEHRNACGELTSISVREIGEGEASCALDVADAPPPLRVKGADPIGEHATLDEVGIMMGGLSRERVRQIETRALIKLRVRR